MRRLRKTAAELFEELNDTDESECLEAKSIRMDTSRSLLETVCSFSNEPGLGGGVILLGVAESEECDGLRYKVEDVDDLDKRQLDLATQCKTCFNRPVFPRITVERIEGHRVLVVEVEELPQKSKPLYFKANKLPDGAYRRVGTADLVCTAEDLGDILDNTTDSYDSMPIRGAKIDEIDPRAILKYRELRRRVNPHAEELDFDDKELLQALNCVSSENADELNLAGVLLFGSSKLQRRVVPMVRIDYIRVPTLEWVEDPDESFSTLDMRGPFILLLDRLINAVNDDLVKDFALRSGDIQSHLEGLPLTVLREAIVNALMHASYKVGSPTQIIRYPNRIEIKNAGYSLKSIERFNTSGSVPRNRIIAPVFHETNLAETKGSGYRRMVRAMERAHLAPPTCESDRTANTFTLRLLLHHFLNDQDLLWLRPFDKFNLSDGQRMALIFLREVGAIDNNTYRQIAGLDTLHASYDLRRLKEFGLVEKKGKGQRTYYRPLWSSSNKGENSPNSVASSPNKGESSPNTEENFPNIEELGKRCSRDKMIKVIEALCKQRPYTSSELMRVLHRSQNCVMGYLAEMVKVGQLQYRFPQMPNHPEQAYLSPPTSTF